MNIALVLIAFIAVWMVTGVVLASAFGPRLRRCADAATTLGHDVVLGADRRPGEPLRWVLPASIVVMVAASSSGLAAAGVLPPKAQVVARSVLGTVGLEVPQPPERVDGPGDVSTSALAPTSGSAPVRAAGPASPVPGAVGDEEQPASSSGSEGSGEDGSGPADAPLSGLPEGDGAASGRGPAIEPPGATPPPDPAPTTTTSSTAPPPPSAEARRRPDAVADAATDAPTAPTSTTPGTTTPRVPVAQGTVDARPDVAPVRIPAPAEPLPAPLAPSTTVPVVPSTTVPVPALPAAPGPAPAVAVPVPDTVSSSPLPQDPTSTRSRKERHGARAEGSSTQEPGPQQETVPTEPATPPTSLPLAPLPEADAPVVPYS